MTDFDPAGPVFISHRHSDGQAIAWQQARALRASGVPVWLDHDDLPPGDTNERLAEALDHGLSGGVLVLTPEVTDSVVVLDLEAPRLFDLAKDHPGFTFAILNEILDEDGSVDRDAPSQITNLETDIDSVLQYSTHDPHRPLPTLARSFAKSRLRQVRVRRETSPLLIDLQTRRSASAYASTADLVFRTVPPSIGTRVPADDVWEDLDAMLAWLPDVLAASRAPEVVFSGGGHLTVAFTIGAALPAPSGIHLAALDAGGELWRPKAGGPPPGAQPLGTESLSVPRPGGSGVAIAVDLHPTPPPVDSFAAHVAGDPGRYVAAYCIERRAWLKAGDGPELVAQVAEEIRRLASHHQDLNVHLFLRTPWVASLLLGASLNTLLLTLYEWDNSAASTPVYVMTRTVASGLGGGPVIHQQPRGDT